MHAGNNEIIASSQVYKSKATCKKGIASVIKNCNSNIEDQTVENYKKEVNPKYEVYKDKKGEFRFRLKSSNGQIIAVGEGYTQLTSCKNGIASIKKNAANASIVDETAAAKK